MSEKMTFKEINQIDVSEHTEQKMNLTYLSWAWAHAEMKKIDENAEIKIHEFPDTDALVALASHGVSITPDLAETITTNYKKDKAGAYVKVSVALNERTETEYLPVMDFKNKAMTNPDAMAINKAHKRCFVKALALHGLGLYIYAGEDLPEQPPVATVTKKQADDLKKQIKELSQYLEDEQGERKTTVWLISKYSQGGETLSDIAKANFDKATEDLQRMINKNKPIADENYTENEQGSLLEGNTTTPKGDK